LKYKNNFISFEHRFWIPNKSKMEKYKNLKDKDINNIVPKELKKFNKLIEGHKKLLFAIGNL